MSDQLGRERVASVLFYGAMLLLAYAVYRIFEPFLVPLGWAVVFVAVFYPWHAKLEKSWGSSRAALISTVAITLILVVPTILLLTAFISQGVDAVSALRQNISTNQFDWFERARDWLHAQIPATAQIDFAQAAREGAERVASFFASRAGGFLKNVVLFFFDLFVMLFALFFLFRDRTAILDGVRRLMPFSDEQVQQLFRQAHDLIQTSVTSSCVIAAMHGFLGGVTFALLGINGAIFWGVTMAFLALIPLLGSGIVITPAVVWLLLTGHITKGIILAAVGFGVIGLVDHLLRPLLVGGRTQMSALVIFISVMGGIGVFGMLGLVMGPIVVATAKSLLDVYGRQQTPVTSPPVAPESASPATAPVLELRASEATPAAPKAKE